MKYANARQYIGDGDVLAWRGRSWVGRLICLVTGAPFSHVGLAVRLHGRLMAVEAVEGRGVVIRPVSRRLPVTWISCAKLNDPLWREALDRVDAPYSYVDAIRAGFGLRPSRKGWQCAEFVMAALDVEDTGDCLPPSVPTPGAVVAWLAGLGCKITVLEAA